jgi:hypothetical protein
MAGRSTFGSTRKLPSGRWQASYHHLGARHLGPNTFNAKADANAYLSGVESNIRRGAWIDPEAGKVLFRDYAEQWRATQAHRVSVQVIPQLSGMAFKLSSTPAFT